MRSVTKSNEACMSVQEAAAESVPVSHDSNRRAGGRLPSRWVWERGFDAKTQVLELVPCMAISRHAMTQELDGWAIRKHS